MKGNVLLFRGYGFISSLIRWQTRGKYSHAALLYPDGRKIIEAWHSPPVVRQKEIWDWRGVDAYDVPSIDDWSPVFKFSESQLGKRYDFISVLRFLDRRETKENNRWFCSELVFAALATKVPVLKRISASNVSPTHLSWSPCLELVRQSP